MKDVCTTSSQGETFTSNLIRLVHPTRTRPGWKDFLDQTATKYEMHVYTMGTRAYAEQVCAAIDPDGKVFGGRVLSRDESGSGSMLYLTANIYSTFARSHSEKFAKAISV